MDILNEVNLLKSDDEKYDRLSEWAETELENGSPLPEIISTLKECRVLFEDGDLLETVIKSMEDFS